MKWYKHDSYAHTDAKLKRLRMKYGMQGYGLYFYCLELIAGSVEKHNLSFALEHDAEVISYDTGIHQELVQEMMTYMVDLGLFENDRGVITCLKLASRTDEYTQQLMRKQDNIPRVSRECPENVRGIRIDKNRTDKKRKERAGAFAPPSLDDVSGYAKERKSKVDPETFIDFYASKNWMVGKNKMKDWKAAFRTWEKRERPGNENQSSGIPRDDNLLVTFAQRNGLSQPRAGEQFYQYRQRLSDELRMKA